MELGIPILAALGGLYMTSNKKKDEDEEENKESFVNAGKNTSVKYSETPKNYPTINESELRNTTVQKFTSPNQATDKYYSKNVFKNENINDKTANSTYKSLTGESIDSNQFKHNNMVPFFGSKIRGRSANSNANEAVMDFATGAGSQMISKSEQAPLFRPQENLDHTYGAPNVNDFLQSRVVNSNRMANVKPWEEERIAPGLNQGFSNMGSGGFNSGLESRNSYMPKNVDQLRVDTNPKMTFSLDNHQGPANSHIKNTSTVQNIGKVEKHLPDTYFDNTADRWLTTTGAYIKPTGRGVDVQRTVHRGERRQYHDGHAIGSVKKTYAPAVYQESSKCELQTSYPTNRYFAGSSAPTDADYGKTGFHVNQTNRNCNKQYGVFGAIKSAIGAVMTPVMDVMKPTRKEDVIGQYPCNGRIYGNPNGGTAVGPYVNNTNDQVGMTNREMNKDTSGFLNVQARKYNNIQITDQDLNGNQRDTTNIAYVGGGGGSGVSNGLTSYEAEYNQTNNSVKETTVNSRMNHGASQKFEHKLNVNIAKQDECLPMRELAPAGANVYVPPSRDTHGIVDAPSCNDGAFDKSRMDPGLLDAFKQNPYTQSLNSIA